MKLIDADALIENIGKIVPSTDYYEFASQICNAIRNQPTTYDVEKVVDAVREDCYSMGFDESQTEIIIKDIRKGGVE